MRARQVKKVNRKLRDGRRLTWRERDLLVARPDLRDGSVEKLMVAVRHFGAACARLGRWMAEFGQECAKTVEVTVTKAFEGSPATLCGRPIVFVESIEPPPGNVALLGPLEASGKRGGRG